MKIETKKKIESAFLLPLAKKLNISPNIITFQSVVIMAGAGMLVLTGELAPAAVLFFFSGIFDALDGLVAKAHGRETKFGIVFDRTADRINDAIILSSIILAGLVSAKLGIVVLALTLLASYVSACIESVTKTRVGEAISLRPIRSAVIIIMLAAPQAAGLLPKQAVYYGMLTLFFISAYALITRLYTAFKILR